MKNQKGITLIALIITIIVMLILVGVSVTVALNGGLFETAKTAREKTETKRDEELALDEGKVEIGEVPYDSINQFVDGLTGSTPTTYEAYEVGDVVTLEIREPADQAGTEQTFYVIEDSDETQSTVKLLAKDCIDTETLLQETGTTYVYFCDASENVVYWGSGTDPYDIIEPEPALDATTGKLTLPSTHTAAKPAYDYGVKFGGEGRLLRYNEAVALYTPEYEDILCGTNKELYYWLGSAYDRWEVYFVDGIYEPMPISHYLCDGERFGVRPVVVISKTEI